MFKRHRIPKQNKKRAGAGRFYRLYAKEPFTELGFFWLHAQVRNWAKATRERRNETVCVYTDGALVAYYPADDWEEVYIPLAEYYNKEE